MEIAKIVSERIPVYKITSGQARWLLQFLEESGEIELKRKRVSPPVFGCKTLYHLG